MCEHNVYVREGDEEILFLEAVDIIDCSAEKLYLRNVLGEEKYFAGELAEVNLMKHRIVLKRKWSDIR
jgi:predicted RNA-binding protein